MKRILLFLFLGISSLAYADVYVITDSNGSIYSLSEQDDAVIPDGYSKDVIRGRSIPELALDSDISTYKYLGKKFIIDTKKVAEKRQKEADMAKVKEDAMTARSSAIGKLKALGLTNDEIKAISQ